MPRSRSSLLEVVATFRILPTLPDNADTGSRNR